MARISGFLKRLFHRSTKATEAAHTVSPRSEPRQAAPVVTPAVRRVSDIPLEDLDRAYIPPLTSSKASFRSDGADHERDQDLGFASASDWNDEDRMTNKSGDPRIGTHRRTQHPDESRPETRE